MQLWMEWWRVVEQLRPACSRSRTFLWMAACLAALTVRGDLLGVTSLVRALGLKQKCYERMLGLFHSAALNLDQLTRLWVVVVQKVQPGMLRVNGRKVLVGDGLKVPKAGKKMPAVKRLHQQSEGNTKPSYIMGHSCQAVAILAGTLSTTFAIPLAARIHEGVLFNNNDKRTLLDKMVLLINSLGLTDPFYFVADAYYASRKIIGGLLANGNHLVARVRKNAVAYEQPPEPSRPRPRGRPRKYGQKVALRSMFDAPETMQEAPSPVYGENNVIIRWRCRDLLWRPVGILVRFVAVIHPTRGQMLLISTDPNLTPVEIIHIYGLRFKIELSFKQALRVIGAYGYHFWMAMMTPIGGVSGNQHLHRKSADYRQAVRRKVGAYHCHIQLGLIAQGLLQYLSSAFPQSVWSSFGSWIRTIRPGLCPSEQVTAMAMRNALPAFLADSAEHTDLADFLKERIDLDRTEGFRLVA
ncbi:MAG TPA: IS4 family transposase [Dehalococcoidia bacterium]|nr:IS4 family transposase [Dehalococcoidia bacterium]